MSATPAYMRLAQMDPVSSRSMAAPSPALQREAGPSRDFKAELAAAFQNGKQAARQELEEEFGLRQELIEATHNEEMRQLLENDVAALARGFEAGLAELRNTLSSSIAGLLRPLLVRWVREESFDAVKEEIRSAVEGSSAGTIVVRGPAPVIERFKSGLEVCGHAMRFEEADGIEVRVVIDQMLIETRIGEWMKLIESAT